MENHTTSYTCKGCGHVLPIQNKVLHDAQCSRQTNTSNVNTDRNINRDSHAQNVEVNNNRSITDVSDKGDKIKKDDNKILLNNQQSNQQPTYQDINSVPVEEEFYHCQKCDQYLPMPEKQDHILVHQFAEEDASEEVEEDNRHEHFHNRNIQNNLSMNNNSNRIIINGVDLTNHLQRSQRGSGTGNSTNRVIIDGVDVTGQYDNNVPNSNNYTVTETVPLPGGGMSIRTTTRSGNSNYVTSTINHGSSGMPRMERMDHMFMPGFPFNQGGRGRNMETFMSNLMTYMNQHGGSLSVQDHPVENDVLNALNEFPLEGVQKMPADKKNCVICLTDFQEGDKAIILPCTHLFHSECIRNWFQRNNTCPICKHVIDRNGFGDA